MPPASQNERVVVSFGSQALAQLRSIASGRSGSGKQPAPGSSTDKSLVDRFGDHARRLERVLGSAAAGGAAAAGGLARRGFSGTVEAARLDYSLDQLGRQMASVFQPVIQALTYGATRFSNALANLSGEGQSRLLSGVLGAGAGYALGGPRGALALGGLGLGGDSSLLGVGAGAFAGFRVAGVPGAVVGGVAGGLLSSPDRTGAGESPGDYYARMRAGGRSRIGAGFAVLGKSLDVLGDALGISEEKFSPPPPPREKSKPPTPLQVEMNQAGGTYFKLQEAVLRTTAGPGAVDAGPLKPFIDGMETIIRLLGKLAGEDIRFETPRAEDTRVK